MEIKIKNKKIGERHPVFFIAEAGVNHNGSVEIAKKLIDIASESGADAVKFQTFEASELNTKTAPKSTYHIETTGDDDKESWYELLKTQEISEEMHIELIDYCKKRDIIFLSTPYGHKSADLLEKLNVPAYKIASSDTNNIPYLKYVAKKGKPIILSSAMATMKEVEDAVLTVKNEGVEDVVMMQCTGNYPSKLSDSNLNVIQTYKKELKCIIGYSDHTTDLINPIAATAMGISVYEKHFTIDKSLPGPDHRMSIEPHELRKTIQLIRKTEMTLGSFKKNVLKDEEENRIKLRKSIVTKTQIPKGETIQSEMLAIKRPGNGIQPARFDEIVGQKLVRDLPKDTLIKDSDIVN